MKLSLDQLRLVLCLGVNCTIGYGTLFYSFSLLALEIEQSLGWSSHFIYGVYSLGLFVGGFFAPYLGKLLDRYGTRCSMALGSLLMACCLYGLSTVESKSAFVIYLLVLEVFSILVLYESAFVAIVKAYDSGSQPRANDNQRQSMTQITLMAGFASTIFWPLIAFLLTIVEWRDVYFYMALIHLLVCFPLHLYGLNPRYKIDDQPDKPDSSVISMKSKPKVQRKQEWLLALSLAGIAFCINGVQIHFFSITEGLNVEHVVAVLAGTLVGPFQVVSRLVDLLFSRRISPFFLGFISVGLITLGLLLLWLTSFLSQSAVLLFAIFFGMGQGLMYIVRGALPLYLFGSSAYGAVTGRLNGVRISMTAAAPLLISLLISNIAVEYVVIILIFLSLCCYGSLVILSKQSRLDSPLQ
ncbi:MFS transporter [Eionea flava]